MMYVLPFIFLMHGHAQEGIIITVAGNGEPGFSGDHGNALQAQLSSPSGVFVDQEGNLFIADSVNHRIRKVDLSGTITTIAGTGTSNYSGDGGPAVDAQLSSPDNIFIDQDNIIFIADTGNHCIRKINNEGIISTVAGNGQSGFAHGETNAFNASFNHPFGLFVDRIGNLFIADTGNHHIHKVDTSGILSSIAGRYSTILDPFGYSGDGGPATNARFWNPSGIFGDNQGNIFIADMINNRIRQIDENGVISTYTGGGDGISSGDGENADLATLLYPRGIFVGPEGNVFISEEGGHRVRRVDTSGIITTVAGNGLDTFSGDNGPAIQAGLNFPRGICVDHHGNLYIADVENHRVRKVIFETNIDDWNIY